MNLQPKMFTDVKNTIESDIKKIVVNDTLDITEFEVKKTDDRVIVNYHIRAADTNNIKKVSFKTENNEEVATLNTDLNIDVDIEITQEFIIEEATE